MKKPQEDQRAQHQPVVVYCRPNEGPSASTLRDLKERGVEYEEVNLDETPTAIDDIKDLGYFQPPVTKVGKRHWAGFRPDIHGALFA